MTEQLQASFDRSVAEAQVWMKVIQERLRINDNTQGPRAELEARLKETEKICKMEPEGNMKVELVVQMAQSLLDCCPESQKPKIQSQLRNLKDQWEDTSTFMTHCHSRIEWVWLQWNEYLLARDKFYEWFQKMLVALEPPIELQLGLREKQWQLSQAQVLWDHVCYQATLLERLLDEAEGLYSRIGDPSVDEDTQKQMKSQYDTVKAKAQERVELLEQVTKEHADFQARVEEFQLWLKASVDKANSCLGPDSTLSTKDRLLELQVLAQEFPGGEESLSNLEEQAVGVIQNTSPLGAQKITEELERMRKVLQKLRLLSAEEQNRLRSVLEAEEAWELRARKLEKELQEFWKILQRLAQQSVPPDAPTTGTAWTEATEGVTTQPDTEACTEDELVARWRHYSTMRAALAVEEPRVQQLETQMKELAGLPHGDPESITRGVVTAIQEFQSLKRASTQLRSEAASGLWQRFQQHLECLQPWKELAQKLLDITTSLPDQASIHTFLPQIEASLLESCFLKERLLILPLQAEVLDSVFGLKQATVLLEQVSSSLRDRDLLHNNLLQRKSKLQSLLAQQEDFTTAFKSLKGKFLDLETKIETRKGLQRDLPGKQVQILRLQGLQEESLDLWAQVEATKPLIQGNPKHQQLMDQLCIDCQALQRSLDDLVDSCRQSVRRHCTFSHQLQELRQWVTVTTQKLESYQEDVGLWAAGPREAEVQKLLAEFPEKEGELSLLQALSGLVVDSTSPEGGILVQKELRQLQESWEALRLLEEKLLSLLRNHQLQGAQEGSPKKKNIFTNNIPKGGFLLDPTDPVPHPRRPAHPLPEEARGREDFSQLLRSFEQWLQTENAKLAEAIAARTATAKDSKTKKTRLQELKARVAEGQRLFENLLGAEPEGGSPEQLEGLSYQWMVYKSKLEDADHLQVRRPRAWGSFLQRVWYTALPLQLLLLFFLLLLFLLPAGDERRSCARANNLARSFRLMLRYSGPPPT